MKKLQLLSILLLIALFSVAQNKETEIDLFGPTEKKAKLSLESVHMNQSGELELGFFIQRVAKIDNKKLLNEYKGNYFPGVKIINFSNDLSLKNTVIENINMNSFIGSSDDYILINEDMKEIGSNTKDLKYDDLQKKYPYILLPSGTKVKDEYFFEIERDLKKRKYDSRFDMLSNSEFSKETAIEKIDLQYPESELLRKEFGYGMENDLHNIFIFASGHYYDKKEIKEDKTLKFNEFRQNEICSFNHKGELIDSYKIDFDYPKVIKFNTPIYSNNKFEGFLYIYGYMMGAKKYNNPETKPKHWAVYFDKNGKHVFTKEFDSQYGSIFYAAHKQNDKLYVFAQGNDGKYGILKISDSEYVQKSISYSTLKENTINGSSEKGIKKSFVPVYQNVTSLMNEAGSFVIIAENKTSKPVVKDGQSSTVTTYNSFALSFDNEGNFKKQYILPALNKSSVSFQKQYNPIVADGNTFVFLSEEMTGMKPFKKNSFSTFMTLTTEGKTEKCTMKYDKIPVMTVIDVANSEMISKLVSKEGFVKLKDQSYYAVDQNNKCVHFVGLNPSRNKLKICKLHY